MAQEFPGFERECTYVDGGDQQVGERLVHGATGVPVVVLRIESVPQVFLWWNTPPNSDRGEPHTQEHLLLGKGEKGKAAALSQGMSLVDSTAYTSQTHTVYAFNCTAGKATFFKHRIGDPDRVP